MEDKNKKDMQELDEDTLEQAAGGIVERDDLGRWVARDDGRDGRPIGRKKFRNWSDAVDYAKKMGWSTKDSQSLLDETRKKFLG